MRPHTLLVAGTSLLLSTACASAVTARSVPPSGSASGSPVAQGDASVFRMLIRRASIDVEVEDPFRLAARADSITRGLGGYVLQSAVTSERWVGSRSATLVLRVPSSTLESALDSLASLGKERSRSSNSRDVTEQVIDLEARVANVRAARDRVRELHARATSLSEVLTLEHELTRLQSQLDALEKQLEHVRGEVSFAEITLTARPRVQLGPVGLVFAALGKAVSWLFVIS
jgi:hypothetical protein